MQVVLAMFRSDGDRRSFSLHKEETVIGRREDCDLRIPLGEISRKHCRLLQEGDQLRVEDLGSSNGTYHNGQRVQEAIINPGDTVQIGSIVFVVQVDGVPADEEMQPIIAEQQPVETEGSGGPITEESESAEEAIPVADADNSGVPLADPDNSGIALADPAASNAGGDFDPMAVLQGGDSQLDGSAINIDLDQSAHGQEV